ncbi:MAG: NusG domain II-containing protein [Lachnospiraceae bacterium]|nr:NusG domain II-containing protein [Lachnospiraceae bacterium]MBP3578630.1 NusG domain II-containing protein [Lachnospiraceae bacterium]
MKRKDLILIGTLLGIAVVLFLAMFFVKQNTVNGEAVILIEGKEYGRYPLSKDTVIEIPGLLGNNVLTIQDGEAFMSSAVCPDKICMEFGKIHYNTEMIVCRPGSIVVIIENGDVSETDAVGL